MFLECGRRRTTEAYLSYKLTIRAFGSGELIMCSKDADRMGNSTGTDQTAPLEAI